MEKHENRKVLHFDYVNDPYAKRLFILLDMFCFSQSVVGSTHKHGHTLDLILFRSSDDIVLLLLLTMTSSPIIVLLCVG